MCGICHESFATDTINFTIYLRLPGNKLTIRFINDNIFFYMISNCYSSSCMYTDQLVCPTVCILRADDLQIDTISKQNLTHASMHRIVHLFTLCLCVIDASLVLFIDST